MRKAVQTLCFVLAAVLVIAVFILGFAAYFVTTESNGGYADGLGRPLSKAPLLLRMIFRESRLWAGWGWFLVDMVVFWGGVAAAIGLATIGGRAGGEG